MTENLKEKFIIEKNDKVGRYTVASEDLKPGQLIFEELPFAYGPKSDTYCMCLGCSAHVDCTNLCSKCSWPVCSTECENLPVHKDNECQVFANANVKFQSVNDPSEICLQYECITPLRVLLATEKDPERWKTEVQIMEHHNEERKKRPIWQFNQTNVVDYLRGPCKLERFSEDLIHTVCGILEINAFESRTPSGSMLRCLYPKLAIMSHNCVSNVHHAIDCAGKFDSKDFRVFVRSATDVKKGEELYSSYTYSLWPTIVRREYLRESKFFDCTCPRCSDKTELGTHMGTLKCQKCDNGVIMSTNPLDNTCEWKCTHCEFKTNGVAVRKVFAAIQADIDGVEGLFGAEGIEAREALFRKYRSVVHPKNAYMTILRSSLVQLYGNSEGYTVDDLPDLLLERKIELANLLMEVLDKIEPGFSRIRGITLYELHAPILILARHQYQSDLINKEALEKQMKEALHTLGKAAEILKNEPLSTPEGQIGQLAQMAHQQLTENFDLMVENA
ncbi:unnamed protein product [Brassicogethes aeneus]|uniref:SET domain-containing protein n=1 Tax=Brassicogethes aeneus TaxID=1431903 RepID=A0A9P0BJL1_BRAAE|nr:unnamed protein product [Brassicogethes aeneus]